MAKVLICDRCGAEIKRSSLGDDFDEVIGDIAGQFGEDRKDIIRPELCKKCAPKFDELIDGFNKKIKDFLSEK